jgi:hypothetical protein
MTPAIPHMGPLDYTGRGGFADDGGMMRYVLATLAVAMLPALARCAPLFGEWGSAFPKGTGAWELDGSYVYPIRFSDDHFYGVYAGAHYYVGDEVSIGVGLDGYFVDQVRDDTELVGANVLFRWHFLADEHYSLFFDGGCGVSYAGMDVPETGLHFNYTPRIGGGGTLKLSDDLHLIGGVRFFHLSNGNLMGPDENPSQDGTQFYVGVLLTF